MAYSQAKLNKNLYPVSFFHFGKKILNLYLVEGRLENFGYSLYWDHEDNSLQHNMSSREVFNILSNLTEEYNIHLDLKISDTIFDTPEIEDKLKEKIEKDPFCEKQKTIYEGQSPYQQKLAKRQKLELTKKAIKLKTNPETFEVLTECLKNIAAEKSEFTVDDLRFKYEHLENKPIIYFPNVFCSVIKKCKEKGIIKAVEGKTTPSQRKDNRSRRLQVYTAS